ncbi:MAG: DNA repair protein RecO C-terminal domain-containing protein [Candidatus Pacebacteria bacterium]|nr:DNA repair protein RecO C-terminal domain-containing protein [Candidatus Paceibacterota bacterium]
MLSSSIKYLNKYDYRVVELNFLAKFLKVLGLTPNLKYCINCQTKIANEHSVFFDKTRGGFTCNKCHKSSEKPFTSQLFKLISVLNELTLKEIIIRDLNTILENRYIEVKKFFDIYIKQTEKYF